MATVQTFNVRLKKTLTLSYGSFASAAVSLDINAEINVKLDEYTADDRGSILCTLNAAPIVIITHGSSQGVGFWNVAGLMWYGVLNENARYDRKPFLLSPYGEEAGHVDTDSMQFARDDVEAFRNQANLLAYAGLLDKYPYTEDIRTSGQGFSDRWGRTLKSTDFNADGSIKPIEVIGVFQRFYAYPTPVPQQAPYYNGNPDDYYARTYAMTVQTSGPSPIWLTTAELATDTKYYPWERKVLEMSNERWLSCNRNYTDIASENRNAYLRRKKSGAWADVLNDYWKNAAADNSSWIKKSSWTKALPVGIGHEGSY